LHNKYRYFLFSILYFAEGIYYTVLIIITPLYLLDKDISLPIITLIIGIGNLPWALKFFWGGIIDFYYKYGRKKYSIIGTFLGAICFLLLAINDQSFSLIFFVVFIFLGHIGIGFLDVSADAWAIEIFKENERGKINCAMNIGRLLGITISAILLTIITENYGFNIAFILSGLIIIIILIFPFISNYSDKITHNINVGKQIINEFKKRRIQGFTFFFFIYAINPGILTAIIVVYSKDVLNLDHSFIGILTAALLFFSIPGSIFGGICADKYSRKKTIYIVLGLVAFFSILMSFSSSWENLFIIFGIVSFAYGAGWSAITALMMDITNKKIGATHFSILTSINNFGEMFGGAIAGTLVVLLGFSNVFILSGLIVIPAFLFFKTYYHIK
jgi:MFS family permease